jgi:sulfotransferase family protein
MSTPLESGRRTLGRARRYGELTLRRMSAGGRPLPTFLVIGAQKAGTTSLHAYLCEHPRVAPPVTKEVHFFDHEFHRGLGWYRAHFKRESEPSLLSGEATPYYLFHPLVPARVAAALPDCKLIVVLRNPIDRAFSHHNHERALGFERLDFEAAIEAEPERLAAEEERILADPAYRSFAHQHHSYLSRGRYAEQLERWLACFDRDRMLMLGAEDLFAEPGSVVREAQEFLGLEAAMPTDLTAKNARAYAPIDAATRAALRDEFAPHNARLYELVGRDFGWD